MTANQLHQFTVFIGCNQVARSFRFLLPVTLLSILFMTSCQDTGNSTAEAESLMLDTIDLQNVAGVYEDPENKSGGKHWPGLDSTSIWPEKPLFRFFDTIILGGKTYFVTEGDILLDEKDLREKLKKQLREYVPDLTTVFDKTQKLYIGYDVATGDTIKWRKFPLRFCIDRASFQSVTGGYDIVKNALINASRDWNNVCGVNFQYLPAFDAALPNDTSRIDFVVTYQGHSVKPYLAFAFYPNEFPSRNQLIIFRGYWNAEDDKTGVIRHEFGHILGFKHEHSAKMDLAPLECRIDFPEDPFPSKPIIEYDKYSVMHYFCGGAGTPEKRFSGNDSIGFKKVYPF